MQAILRLPSVQARTGLSRSTIYLRIAREEFPKPISLGSRAIGFLESEIDSWISSRVEESRSTAGADERPRKDLDFLAAVPDGEESNDRWLNLLSKLHLKWDHYIDLINVVREKDWRDKADPEKLIRTRVIWRHWRLDCGPRKEITGYYHPGLGSSNAAASLDAAAGKSALGTDRGRRYLVRIAERLPAQYVTSRPLSKAESSFLAELNRFGDWYPDDWDSEGPVDRAVIPNWDKIAADAGLDHSECRAVVYRAKGISREQALAEQRSESTRRSLQSAFKRLQRGKWDKLNQFVHNLIAQEQARKFPDVYTFAPEDVETQTEPAAPNVYTLREAAMSFFRRGESLVKRWVDAGMLCPIGASGDASKPVFTKEDLDRFKQEREPFVQSPVRPK